MSVKRRDKLHVVAVGYVLLVGLSTACGSTDERFAAETLDEYTEPLTDAVIGTPEGVVKIGGAAAEPSGPVTRPPTPPGLPGGPATGGTGGTGVIPGAGGSGTGGTSTAGAGGSVGTGAGGGSSTGGSFATGGSGGGSTFDGGVAGSGGGDGSGFGLWHFDDCSPTSNFLADSSGMNANAQHALKSSCVPGITGQGVAFRSGKDIVQVPDEPQFTVSSRVAVAAWVRPNTVSGNQPIIIKRLNNQTAFSLGIHNGNIEMSVVLTTGTTVISRAPIQAGEWTHVAGMYDGTFVFLFINGQQFGQVFAAGTVRNVFAPIRIGATTQAQFFNGVIDDVFVSSAPVSKEELAAQSCIHRPTTLAVNPTTSGVVAPGTTVRYEVAISNHDVGMCQPANYDTFFNSDPQFNIDPPFAFLQAAPGATVSFATNVTSTDDVDPGIHDLSFNVLSFSSVPPFDSEFLVGQLRYEAAEPTGCFVRSSRELMIKHLSVVDDPVRTAGNGVPRPVFDGGAPPPPRSRDGGVAPGPIVALEAPDTSRAVWSFGHLMRELAPTPEQAPAMAEQVFRSFLTNQTVNGFTVEARPAMQQVVLDNWPRTANNELDLDRAPVILQAIVNRIDVRDLALGSGGEGRFVFGVNGPFGQPLEFTLIFEFNLPARTEQDVLEWASLWHGLSSHPFPSEEYNAALEVVTRRFSGRNASPGSVNGSALFSFRSNEIALSGRWQLRQFDLSPETGFFRQVPLSETPDLAFNGSAAFASFVNDNAEAIIAEVPGGLASVIPLQLGGKSFQAGSIFNDLIQWSAPQIVNPDARFHASMNTCNGCHGPETNSGFLQITPRGFGGGEATLSPFITGTTVFDRFSGQVRTLNDLKRRKDDLTRLVCPPDPDGGSPAPIEAGGPTPVDAGPPRRDAAPPRAVDAGRRPVADAGASIPAEGGVVILP